MAQHMNAVAKVDPASNPAHKTPWGTSAVAAGPAPV